MAACPYGSRSFNFRDPAPYIKNANPDFPRRTVGVVEKCNFCEERLAQNLLPACVEAAARAGCNAMVFVDLLNPSAQADTLLASKNAATRSPALGTLPKVFYLL
jgi:molybdopterin-containing oxidoreductase family iron-sulfur binding subunit